MSYYNLVSRLEEIEIDRRKQLLFETTTMDAITYLPAQVGAVRRAILKLSKEKPEWGIELLETDDGKVLQIENRLKITVPNEHWNDFLSLFKGEGLKGNSLNLSKVLEEAIEDDMKELRRELKAALTELFNREEFDTFDNLMDYWRALFGVVSYRTRVGTRGPVVSYERKGKDIQKLYGKLLRSYGEDKGYLEMLINDIKNKRPLSSYDVFKNYDYLYGTKILSEYQKVSLISECSFSMIYVPEQFIYITTNNIYVLDKIEEDIVSVKRVKNKIYPVGESFTYKTFKQLKEVIDDVVSEE